MAAPGNGAPVGSSQGERIGKYQIITRLSVGGMAELFIGFTSGPGGFRKYVALKRILPDVRSNEAFKRMFLDEARITAAFNHPNIAQVYELGQEEDGLFLAMEFIAGQNLDQLTAAYERRGEPIPLGLSVAVMRDVSQALHYAHTFTEPSGRASPIIHRDVAQKNIMVTYDGVVKLLDFGIAKARNSLERTRAGTVKGTAGYMSPEQVRGDPLDGRSDVFSAGVVLWELITGTRLFGGNTEREEMLNILQAPIPAPTHPSEPVSEELAAVVLQALEREPEQRFQSGRDLARALEQAGGRELFDAEQRASVMRELFEKKMATTQALLESADALVEDEPQEVEPARRERARAEPAKKRAAPVPRRSVGAAPRGEKVPEAQVDPELTQLKNSPGTRPAPPTAKDATQGGKLLNGVLWGAVLLSLILGGGYLVMTLTRGLEEPVLQQPSVQELVDPRIKAYPESGQPEPPAVESAAADAGTSPSDAVVAEDKPSRPGRVAQGKMTLIINPEAQVFRGKRSLGKTPMFNQPMPAGTHLLRIVGPDKKARVLSVQIGAGKTTSHRFSLSDIPEAR
ncbi:MAG: protein kinase [Myxococcaceae bacterium]|nr:protein kinase [Myxococcaceae bacterium]